MTASLIALAGLAIGLFAGHLWKGKAKYPKKYARVVAVGLIVLFVVGVVWKGIVQIREVAVKTGRVNQLPR